MKKLLIVFLSAVLVLSTCLVGEASADTITEASQINAHACMSPKKSSAEEQQVNGDSLIGSYTIIGSENECGLPFTPADFVSYGVYDSIRDKIDGVLRNYYFGPLSAACYNYSGSGVFSSPGGNSYYYMEDGAFTQLMTTVDGVSTAYYFHINGQYIDEIEVYYDVSNYYDSFANPTHISFLSSSKGITGIQFTNDDGTNKLTKKNTQICYEEEYGGYCAVFDKSQVNLNLGGLIQINLEYNSDGLYFNRVEFAGEAYGLHYVANFAPYLSYGLISSEISFTAQINGEPCELTYSVGTMECLNLMYYFDHEGKDAFMSYTILPWEDEFCATSLHIGYPGDSESYIEFDEDGYQW